MWVHSHWKKKNIHDSVNVCMYKFLLTRINKLIIECLTGIFLKCYITFLAFIQCAILILNMESTSCFDIAWYPGHLHSLRWKLSLIFISGSVKLRKCTRRLFTNHSMNKKHFTVCDIPHVGYWVCQTMH